MCFGLLLLTPPGSGLGDTLLPGRWRWGWGCRCWTQGGGGSAEGLSGRDPDPCGQVGGDAWPACVCSGNLPQLPSWGRSVTLAAGSDLVQRHRLPAGKTGVGGEAVTPGHTAGRGRCRGRTPERPGPPLPGQHLLLSAPRAPPRPILAAFAGSEAPRAVSGGEFMSSQLEAF